MKREITIERKWAMPSRHTFKIKPIRQLLNEFVHKGWWIDPFAGYYSLASVGNDIDPETPVQHHKEALEFLKGLPDNCADGVLFDPPYSVRQLSECYKKFGLSVNSKTTRSDYWTKLKREITRILKVGGVCISFGWNSGGIGKTLGFKQERILLVAHGGIHNDTICVVEKKIQDKLL